MNDKKYRCLENYDIRSDSSLIKDDIYEESYLKQYYFIDLLIYQKIIIPLDEWREKRINKILDNE